VHLVHALRGDRTQLLFVDFYAVFGCTLRWHDVQIYSSAELREVAGMAGPFLHGQIPHCAGYFPRDADETAAASSRGKHVAYISTRLANVKCRQAERTAMIQINARQARSSSFAYGNGPLTICQGEACA
jgi:hypothetical protein